MRTFVIVSGVAFACVFIAHILRLFAEGMHLLAEPVFLSTSIASLAISAWSLVLVRRDAGGATGR